MFDHDDNGHDLWKWAALTLGAQLLAAGLLLLADDPWPWLRMAVGVACVFTAMAGLGLFVLWRD